jgi:hypothetical protein
MGEGPRANQTHPDAIAPTDGDTKEKDMSPSHESDHNASKDSPNASRRIAAAGDGIGRAIAAPRALT